MQGFETTLPVGIDEADALVRDALRVEGFGVLTEIDVAATLREKLGIDRTPMRILGACNPALAHRALEHDPTVGLLLPCNVVLEQDGESTRVTAVDPREMFEILRDDALRDVAEEAAGRLERAVFGLRAAA